MVKPSSRVTQNGEAEAAPASGRFRALAVLSAAVALGLSALSPASAAERPAPSEPAVSGDAGLRIARAFRTAGDPSSSLQIYRNLTSQLPPDSPLRVEFADALLEAKAIDEAIGLYMAAPNNPRAELGLARAQMALDQPAKALVFA